MERYRRITRKDRYQIQRFLTSGKSISWISDALGFHRSSIYREVSRGIVVKNVRTNTTPLGEYSAYKAHHDAYSKQSERRGCFYKGHKIKGWVEDQIRLKITEGWSPEQISNRLRIEKQIMISTEGIYKFILSCKRRHEDLHKYLRRYRRRQRRFKRRSRYWELQYQRRKSIDDRPVAANERKEVGHWERDLMLGKRGTGAVLTIVDRKTQYTLLEKLRTTFANETNIATERAINRSRMKCMTMTNDNGHEFGEFWSLETRIKAPVYFTHALCPWERGTVENTIGLLRQFIPKGKDLSVLNKDELIDLELTVNSRPRKKLNFKTPIEIITGKKQKLIKQKRLELPPPEYYEQFYLTAEEIKKKNLRGKTVAMTG